jgi:hypothetical protein
MVTRRQIFTLLAGGAVAASGLLLPERSIFLPPYGGWIVAAKRMEVRAEYAHIWQQELDSGVVTVDAGNPDHLQLWTSAPLESQPLKDWRQFIVDWRKERGEDVFSWLKETPQNVDKAPAKNVDIEMRAHRVASDNLAAMRAGARVAEIRAGMQTRIISA